MYLGLGIYIYIFLLSYCFVLVVCASSYWSEQKPVHKHILWAVGVYLSTWDVFDHFYIFQVESI